MTAEPDIMKLYAGLVMDPDIKATFLKTLLDEYEQTREMLELLYAGNLEEQRPNLSKALKLRAKPLEKLHRLQVELLEKWRSDPEEAVLTKLLVTVNAIAGGLRTTG
jgi:phosphoenolpyruvate carboxylase